MSPAEQMRALLLADETCRQSGIELVDVTDECAVVTMTVSTSYREPVRVLHAAHIFLLAEVAVGLSAFDPARPSTSVNGSISLLAPAKVGDELVAESRLRAESGRRALYDVAVFRVSAGDRIVVAEFRGETRQLTPREPTPIR